MNCTTVDAKVDLYYSGKDPVYEYHLKSEIKHKVFIAEDLLKKREENSINPQVGARQLLHQAAAHHWTVVIKLGNSGENLRFEGEYKILRLLADAGLKASAHILRPQRVVLENTALWKEGNSEKYSECNHPPFMVLPYIPQSRDFHRLVHAGHKGEEFAQQWSAVLFDLLALLEKCGIIHRDISPSNFLIDTHNKLYLIDFERAFSVEEALDNLRFSGTRGYMAPEVMEQHDKLTAAADQYSMAAVLLYLLTGIEPINVGADNNLQNLYAALADDLRPVLQKAMAENPQDRYENTEQLREAWNRVFSDRVHNADKEKKRKREEKNRLELALEKEKIRAEVEAEYVNKSAPVLQPAIATVKKQTSNWASYLVWLALLSGLVFLSYPKLKAKLQPAPVQVSADLVRTQEGDVILKRDSGFDLTSAPYQLNLPQKGECHYRETQSHPAGGLLAYRCTAETAGEQEWNLRNSHNQLVAKGRLTVEPQQLVFNPKITPANAQITFNCPQLMRSCHAWKDKTYKVGTKIPEGSYELQVSAPGYQTQTQSIRLQLPDQTSVQLNLTPLMQKANLHLTPANSKIRVVSAKLHAQGLMAPTVTLGEQHLPLGIYELEVSAQNYQSQKVTLVVNEKQAAALTLELSLGAYRLVNQVIPANARVEHEGKVIDLSHHSFGAGKYSFVITHPDYESQTVSVEIGEGKANTLKAGLVAKTVAQTSPASPHQAYELEMVTIPAGNFMMGDDKSVENDEKPAHRVTIKSFKIMTKELTRGEFAKYVAATGYKTDAERNLGGKGCQVYNNGSSMDWKEGASWRSVGFSQTDSHPVVCVSHNDAVAYAKWLSQQTGKRYRLPTEAEWEYAARAKSVTAYSFGSVENKLCQYGNVADKTAKARYPGLTIAECTDGYVNTAPVGQFEPNAFGLYDTHGNVWEWVQDCYHDSYKAAPNAVKNNGAAWEDGSNGACTTGTRVLRGGSWGNYPGHVRSANRNWSSPAYRFHSYGFRLVQDI